MRAAPYLETETTDDDCTKENANAQAMNIYGVYIYKESWRGAPLRTARTPHMTKRVRNTAKEKKKFRRKTDDEKRIKCITIERITLIHMLDLDQASERPTEQRTE